MRVTSPIRGGDSLWRSVIQPTLPRKIERLLSDETTVSEACRQLGIGAWSYYRRKRNYGAMRPSEVYRTCELEKENQRLRKLIAELAIDN